MFHLTFWGVTKKFKMKTEGSMQQLLTLQTVPIVLINLEQGLLVKLF